MFHQQGGYGGYPPPYQPTGPAGWNGIYGAPSPGGGGGGGGGGGVVLNGSGDAILEFPSPYPQIYGGGPGGGGGGAGAPGMYGGSTSSGGGGGGAYTTIPHFAPQGQQPPQQSSQPAQQQQSKPASPNPAKKPIQPSGMIRPFRRQDTPSTGTSSPSSASSPTSPAPPSASSLSSSSSHTDDYSFASAPPYSFFPAYGGPQPTGLTPPVYGQPPQMTPDLYHMGASAYQPYNNAMHTAPTAYQQMPSNYADHTQPHQNYLHMSAPSAPQHQQTHHYQPLRYSDQSQHRPQQTGQHVATPAAPAAPAAATTPAAPVASTTPATPAAAEPAKQKPAPPPRGTKVMLPAPPPKRNTVDGSTKPNLPQHLSALELPRRTISEPLSELEEKLRERNLKRRDSVPAAPQQGKPISGVQHELANASLPERKNGESERKEKENVKEDQRKGAAPPAITQQQPKADQLYVDTNSLSLKPENEYDATKHSDVEQNDSDEDEECNYVETTTETDEYSEVESEYESYIDDPKPYAAAASTTAVVEAEQKPSPQEEAKLEEKGKKQVSSRKSVRRENRWEIEYEELDIDKRIGQGAYGSVYKGKWRNTVVAIKTIRENMDSFNEAKLAEFRSEAEMMMNMRPHTNVVQLFGVCMRPYMAIVVEFLSGGSLQELLLSNVEIDLYMALKIALHAAAGVAHLHAEGICHRDLAARNLLLTSKNKEYMVVKVADFGLSRFSEEAEENFTTCKVGPLKWMPPESLQEQKYSFKSDVWSMGVVLWEIFSRREPFPGVSPVQVAINVTTRGVCLNPPSSCPREIAQLMYDCWSYEPKDRPDFRTIAQTIERVLEMNLPNYNITPMSSDEPVSGQHPARCKSSFGK